MVSQDSYHACTVQVPRNMQLVAVPLIDLYGNMARWGQIICALPLLLSRLRLTLVGSEPILALPAPEQKEELVAA